MRWRSPRRTHHPAPAAREPQPRAAGLASPLDRHPRAGVEEPGACGAFQALWPGARGPASSRERPEAPGSHPPPPEARTAGTHWLQRGWRGWQWRWRWRWGRWRRWRRWRQERQQRQQRGRRHSSGAAQASSLIKGRPAHPRPAPPRSAPVLTHRAPEAPRPAPLPGPSRAGGPPRPWPLRRASRRCWAFWRGPGYQLPYFPESLGFAQSCCCPCLVVSPQRHKAFVHLRNKTGSYPTSKMGLFTNSKAVLSAVKPQTKPGASRGTLIYRAKGGSREGLL